MDYLPPRHQRCRDLMLLGYVNKEIALEMGVTRQCAGNYSAFVLNAYDVPDRVTFILNHYGLPSCLDKEGG